MKILIINQYAGNKGDRAVLFSLCNLLKTNRNDVDIKVSTSEPSLWKNYYYYSSNNIEFIPSAWDYENISKKKFITQRYFRWLSKIKKYTYTIIRENYLSFNFPISKFFANPFFRKAVKESDIIISTGGHHFTTILSRDLVSSLPFDLCIARSLKRNIFLFSQSFGPFEFHNNRNKRFIRKLLNNCSTLGIREHTSFLSLNKLEVRKKHRTLIPETVISLNRLFPKYILPSKRAKKVGLSIYSTKKRDERERQHYLNCIIQLCDHLSFLGYETVFFPMELKGTKPDDRNMLTEITARVIDIDKCEIFDKDLETVEHLKEVAKCQFFIGHKTHSVIFALTSGTPLLAIEYHPKTKEFMKQYEVEQFSIPESLLAFKILKEKFSELSSDYDEIGVRLFNKSRQFSRQLDFAIDEILN